MDWLKLVEINNDVVIDDDDATIMICDTTDNICYEKLVQV